MSLKWKVSSALSLGGAKKEKRRLNVVGSLEDLNRERPPSIAGLIDDVLERSVEKKQFFRPSMLHGCDRANVFHYPQMAPFHPQRQSPRMIRVLDNGTAIHEVIQGYLADHPEWFFAKESRIYKKVSGAWIRGSCDGVLIRRSDGYRVGIEIKTIAHEQFMKLTSPKPWHVKQASVYARLQKLHWIVVVYWDKDKQNIKDFPIEYDPKAWQETKERVRYLKRFVDEGELPEFDAKQCDPTFCQYVDHCKKKGGKPHMVREKSWG